MLEIDCSFGEGGGQVIRTAVALSILTNIPVHLYNIRAKRSNPGLREQHLKGILAAKELCNGKIKNAFLGSKEIWFYPGERLNSYIKVKIATAGSVGLVLQTLLLSCLKAEKEIDIEIEGGATYGKFAPSIHYLQKVLLPLLAKIGYNVEINVEKQGFYPKGGAKVLVKVLPVKKLNKLDLIEKGKLTGVNILSIASENLKIRNVAERQAEKAKEILKEYNPHIKIEYVNTLCPGSGILCFANFENTVLGFDSVGEIRKKAEDVGKESAIGLKREIESKATLDIFASDQILPYLAFAKGSFLVRELSLHAKTNIEVIRKFLDVDFKIERVGEHTTILAVK